MYHVKDSLALDLNLGGYEVEGEVVSFGKLLMTSSVLSRVPLIQLNLADTGGELKKRVSFEDGMTIKVNLGRSESSQVEYNFRLFNHRESASAGHRHYMITGYLDVPKYFIGSSFDHYKGPTSKVISDIAGKTGLTADVDTTADDQTWFQANMKNCEFVQYLTKRGYISDKSLMMSAVTLRKKLLYKDFNAIEGDKYTFAYIPSSDKSEIAIFDHVARDKSGSSNASRGYKDNLYAQDLTVEEPVKHSDSNIKPRASKVALNSDVQGAVGDRSRVDLTPPHYKGMAHDNYFKAKHQNTRGRFLNSVGIDILTGYQLDDADLMLPVGVRLKGLSQAEETPEASHDGSYIITGKNIIAQGPHYAERYNLIRAGKNNK